jgi:hypothetical protein
MEEFDTIRCLSQVGRQITAELGECLWKNSIVHFSEAEHFFVFFKDRPKIWSSVQGISLTIYYQQSSMGTTPTSLLYKTSEFVSQNLNLRLFTICLRTRWGALGDLPEIKNDEMMYEWTTIFRSLKIQEAFTVNLQGRYACAWDTDESQEELCEKIIDLWLPDTFRKLETPEQKDDH